MGDVIRIGALLRSIERAKAAAADSGGAYEASVVAEERRRRMERLDKSGCRVSDAMRKVIAFESLDDTHARQAVSAWVDDHARKPWLILSGGTGCGKSVAVAESIARFGGRYARADDVVRAFSSLWDGADVQKDMRERRLLAIDDLGTEREPDRMLHALLELLDVRTGGRQPATLVTTNLTRNAMGARYAHERLLSRLNERVQWVTLTGDDMRRKK